MKPSRKIHERAWVRMRNDGNYARDTVDDSLIIWATPEGALYSTVPATAVEVEIRSVPKRRAKARRRKA